MERTAYVILTWNSRDYIAACLGSVWAIPSPSQVIVADNGSRDGTPELLEELSRRCPAHSSLEVIPLEENLGTTRPRNLALARVRKDARWICVLDSDTRVNAAAMEELARQLREHPDLGVAGPRLRDAAGRLQPSGRNFPTFWGKMMKASRLPFLEERGEALERPPGENEAEPYPVGYLMSACWLLPREVMAELGGFDERIFYAPEDAEFCARVWQSGRKVVLCPQAEILHHWQRLSRRRLLSRHNLRHLLDLLYFLRKHRRFLRGGRKDEEQKTQR